MPTAERDAVKIHYEVAGDASKEPLLLVMGYGLPGSAWMLSLPYFTDRFQVCYFDNRGTGASDAPDGDYDIPTFAADALAVMDALDWGSAHVFGVSMGGMIAQALALAAPERVRSLVLGCTSSGVPEPTPAQLEAVKTLGEAVALMPTDPQRFAELAMPLSYPQAFIDAHPELIPLTAMMVGAMPTKKAPEIRVEDADLIGWSSHERLDELTMPALILHGTEDRLIPVTHAHALFDGLPNPELRIFKGAGHAFQAHDPVGINKGIAEWLAARVQADVPTPAGAAT